MPNVPYKLWQTGKDRFAVTRDQHPAPVLGVVSRNGDESWKIERGGKILRAVYPSASDAARALVELAANETTQTRFYAPAPTDLSY